MKYSVKQKSLILCTSIFFLYFLLGGYLLYGAELKERIQSMTQWALSLQPTKTSVAQIDPIEVERQRGIPPLNLPLAPVYEVDAILDSEKKITGKVKIQFLNPGQKELFFYLYEYPAFPFQIQSITFQDRELSFKRSPRLLSLENPVGQNVDKIDLEINFVVPVPPQGTRFGVKNEVWLLTNWYPQLGVLSSEGEWVIPPAPVGYGDPFYYQYGDYTIRLLSDSSIRWLSSGESVAEETRESGLTLTTWKADRILTFALVGSPHFIVESFPLDDQTTMDIALVDQGKMSEVSDLAKRAALYYRDIFGPLPYKKISLIETGYGTNYAMEYSNLAIFSRDMYKGNRIQHWVPHEIAHLWWYNAVGTWEPTYGWIDEGLSEWSYLNFLRQESEVMASQVLNQYKVQWEALQENSPHGFLNKGLASFDHEKEWNRTWYAKSVLVFENLFEQVGEEDFQKFAQKVLQDHSQNIIGPRHLDHSLSSVLGKDTDYFRKNSEAHHEMGILPLAH